ncbi:MAG: hypothetical protein OHK0023_07130 [Anaerolineae bacterium]
MHEFSIVSDLVNGILPQLADQHISRVTEIRFRRGTTFSEDALRLAFEAHSIGTPLHGATLIVETTNTQFHCECGYEQTITHDDLLGHAFVCPKCGAVSEIDEAHDLELLSIRGISTDLDTP